MKMCSISVEPIPSRISTPTIDFHRLPISAGSASGRDATAQALRTGARHDIRICQQARVQGGTPRTASDCACASSPARRRVSAAWQEHSRRPDRLGKVRLLPSPRHGTPRGREHDVVRPDPRTARLGLRGEPQAGMDAARLSAPGRPRRMSQNATSSGEAGAIQYSRWPPAGIRKPDADSSLRQRQMETQRPLSRQSPAARRPREPAAPKVSSDSADITAAALQSAGIATVSAVEQRARSRRRRRRVILTKSPWENPQYPAADDAAAPAPRPPSRRRQTGSSIAAGLTEDPPDQNAERAYPSRECRPTNQSTALPGFIWYACSCSPPKIRWPSGRWLSRFIRILHVSPGRKSLDAEAPVCRTRVAPL